MRKYADRYFGVDPWLITEEGFNPSYSEVAESIFSLANEHMGLRGYFDEGFTGDSLRGCYVNGIYERSYVRFSYKGIPTSMEFIVNTVDWIATKITADEQVLDLSKSKISEFKRSLDMRTGELTRSFIWHVDSQTSIKFTFNRILSMTKLRFGASRIRWEILSGNPKVTVTPKLILTRDDIWEVIEEKNSDDLLSLIAITKESKQKLYVTMPINRKECELSRSVSIVRGTSTIQDTAPVLSEEEFNFICIYEQLLEENRNWWANQWALSDIEIDGSPEDQQGIRYCVFQMHQTLHSGKNGVAIGAKGLTGEVYGGATFWDTEIYCLPFYLFTNPEAALGILQFRSETLDGAKKRAAEMDLDGAFYPISTISGDENCTLWQHANQQLQPSTAVAYAIWQHAHITGDRAFLLEKGIPMLEEICRMLATRGDFCPITGKYGYYGVMGPDEFQLMVNNNLYTNFMAKKTFEFTLETLASMGIPETPEHKDWRYKSDMMYVEYDPETLLYEQHDGYFRLPHIDIKSIPPEEFPLYHHWSYDRIYRNNIIKQPDVLMFMILYAGDFNNKQLAANFDYYEPRCLHESSLSPSVHSILAARLGRMDRAFDFFRFAARLDLDNYNRNTNEGLHMASIAGSWMNIIYGFGGLESDGDTLSFNPTLPSEWDALRFKLKYRGSVLSVEITSAGTTVKRESGNPLTIKLLGKDYHC